MGLLQVRIFREISVKFLRNFIVGRALGDFHMTPFVSSDPYVNQLDLCEDDQFLIIACTKIH